MNSTTSTTNTTIRYTSVSKYDKQRPVYDLYRPKQFVRFIMPTSRRRRVGHIRTCTKHYAYIDFVGRTLADEYKIMTVRVDHCDIFQDVDDEDYKLYAIDLLKAK